jgi:hypothetical protein
MYILEAVAIVMGWEVLALDRRKEASLSMTHWADWELTRCWGGSDNKPLLYNYCGAYTGRGNNTQLRPTAHNYGQQHTATAHTNTDAISNVKTDEQGEQGTWALTLQWATPPHPPVVGDQPGDRTEAEARTEASVFTEVRIRTGSIA